MKVLLVHNFYQQPGGEDRVFHQEGALLEAYGNTVIRFSVSNHEIRDLSKWRLVADTFWNTKIGAHIRTLIERERPAGMHCHNIFPLLSPAIYYTAQALHIPVVQTLHNYRLLCPSAILYRAGHTCEACLGTVTFWPGVLHGCYQNSRAATVVTAAMLSTHRWALTWSKKVDRYIALSDFARNKFIQGGLPADRISVKPNFLQSKPASSSRKGGYALYVGRLVEEKGLAVLLEAWQHIGMRLPLKIVGDGPLSAMVSEGIAQIQGVVWLGNQSCEQVHALMQNAEILVLPSLWYEGFPMTVVEAYAAGLPIVASNIGSLSSLVEHGRTGRQFRPGSVLDLCSQIEWILSHPQALAEMRQAARMEFDRLYSAESNYRQLMRIYQAAGAEG